MKMNCKDCGKDFTWAPSPGLPAAKDPRGVGTNGSGGFPPKRCACCSRKRRHARSETRQNGKHPALSAPYKPAEDQVVRRADEVIDL